MVMVARGEELAVFSCKFSVSEKRKAKGNRNAEFAEKRKGKAEKKYKSVRVKKYKRSSLNNWIG